jgi:DNA modification methylase
MYKTKQMIIEIKKISELTPAPYNPRESTEKQESQLKQSLKKFGVVEPIIYNKQTGYIVGGHFRVRELQKLGYTEIECVIVDLSEEDEKELNIRLNANTGQWDWDELANNFELEDLNDWGLEVPNMKHELEAEEDDFDVDADGIETDIVLGDLFEIGEHRLLCGDSTDSDAVARLMDGQKADMVFTDPPYKIETDGGAKGDIGKALRKQGKDIEFIAEFNPLEFLQILPLVFDKNMNAYIFCNNELLPDYLIWARDAGYSFNVLIWKKPNAIPINSAHRPDIEYILLFRKSSIWNYGLQDVNYSRCLEFARESGLHPTMKPIELIANEMKISSHANSLVFDFFLGSGSTMVASHQLKRKCYGMELDPKYCQVIIDRMKKLDPTIKIKRNGVEL